MKGMPALNSFLASISEDLLNTSDFKTFKMWTKWDAYRILGEMTKAKNFMKSVDLTSSSKTYFTQRINSLYDPIFSRCMDIVAVVNLKGLLDGSEDSRELDLFLRRVREFIQSFSQPVIA